jgi:ankyrin repeat protein
VELVRLLLERGAEINQANEYGGTALRFAVSWGYEEIVSILVSNGADPSKKGYRGQTALMRASWVGHVPIVRLLLRSMGGGGLDECDEDGRTALCYACLEGHADVVRALLLAGADRTIAPNGTTPLQVAEKREHHECIGVIQVRNSSCHVHLVI